MLTNKIIQIKNISKTMKELLLKNVNENECYIRPFKLRTSMDSLVI